MSSALKWTFAIDVTVSEGDDGAVTLRKGGTDMALGRMSPGIRAAIIALAAHELTEPELAEMVISADGEGKLPVLYYQLSRFSQRGLLLRVASADGNRYITASAVSRSCRFKSVQLDDEARYTLSRFAYLHREGDALLLESPLNHARVQLHSWHAAAVIGGLSRPVAIAELARSLPVVGGDDLNGILSLLLSLDLVCEVDQAGVPRQEADIALQQWEFHDLLFHTSSRMGRQARPLGGTFRFRGSIPPLPALKAPMSAEYTDLYAPDIAALAVRDLPFTSVLESRKSIRTAGDEPITATQLGEFLYRVARVRTQVTSDSGEYAFRVYPGGGGEYELELYLAITACDDLLPGLYHYAPAEHRLYRLSDLDDRIYTIVGMAAGAAVRNDLPDVLIILAARFQRVSWKYESIAYSVILKDVGVLLQTMYLVATAMGLGPCAVGAGDSDLFASVVGTNYYAETSVGEFLLGARPRDLSSEPSGIELAEGSGGRWG